MFSAASESQGIKMYSDSLEKKLFFQQEVPGNENHGINPIYTVNWSTSYKRVNLIFYGSLI